jgi:hypothetical protein
VIGARRRGVADRAPAAVLGYALRLACVVAFRRVNYAVFAALVTPVFVIRRR